MLRVKNPAFQNIILVYRNGEASGSNIIAEGAVRKLKLRLRMPQDSHYISERIYAVPCVKYRHKVIRTCYILFRRDLHFQRSRLICCVPHLFYMPVRFI